MYYSFLLCIWFHLYSISEGNVVETFNVSTVPYQNVTLECRFTDNSKNIFSIEWRKDSVNRSISHIASIKETNIDQKNKIGETQYYNYNNFNVTSKNDMKITTLTIVNVTPQESRCFTCTFRANRETSIEYTNKTCINLHDYPTISVSSTLSSNNKGNITCLSTGYFQQSVQWINVSGINNLTENISNHNGTVSTKNTIYLDILKEEVCCKNNIGNVTCIKPYKIHKENVNHLIIASICTSLFIVMTATGISVYWYWLKRKNKRARDTDYTKMKI
nr:glycoprotein vOX2-2 [Elephant endotheliotropic herpesvirus 5A]